MRKAYLENMIKVLQTLTSPSGVLAFIGAMGMWGGALSPHRLVINVRRTDRVQKLMYAVLGDLGGYKGLSQSRLTVI